jgi:hypothetical protein
MKLLGGIGLVVLGLIAMIYGHKNVTSRRGGIITRLFSSAGKPMASAIVKLQSWLIGFVLIGFGISILMGDLWWALIVSISSRSMLRGAQREWRI